MKITPYLLFNGQCEEAFRTYERVLGGKIIASFTFGNSPMAAKFPELANKIMHARIDVGDQMILGADCPPEYFKQPQAKRYGSFVDRFGTPWMINVAAPAYAAA